MAAATEGHRNGVRRVQRQLVLEEIEPRIAPAGGVVTAVVGGTLVITGDDSANDIVIDHVGPGLHDIRISSGADATTIDGQASVTVQNVTKDVKILLAGGDDKVSVAGIDVARNLVVDDRAGNNQFSMDPASVIRGSLTVKNGDGNELVAIAGTVTGNVTITEGRGDTIVGVAGAVGGGVSVREGDGAHMFAASNLTVGGNLAISHGNGSTSVQIQGTQIHGGVKVTAKTGADEFILDSSTVGRSVALSNGVGGSAATIEGSTVKGSLAAKNSDGDDVYDILNSSLLSVTLRNGAGGSHLLMDRVTIAKSVGVVNGDGYDDVAVNNSTIKGSMSVNHGSGDSATILVSASIGMGDSGKGGAGSLMVKGGDGQDGVLGLRMNVGRNMSLSLGNGDNAAQLEYVQVVGNASVKGGGGTDQVYTDRVYMNRAFSINTGSGNDGVRLDDANVQGVDTAAGVVFADGEPTLAGSVFNGAVRINLGAGDDALAVGTSAGTGNPLVFRGSVTVNGGSGNDAAHCSAANYNVYYHKNPTLPGVETKD